MLGMFLDILKSQTNISIIVLSPDEIEGKLKDVEYISNSKIVILANRFFYLLVRVFEKAINFIFNRNNAEIRPSFFSGIYFFISHTIISVFQFLKLLFKKKGVIVCIDAGGLTPARWINIVKKMPVAYAIYEIYPNQFKIGKCFYRYLQGIERRGIKIADVLFSPINEIVGKLVLRRYKLSGKRLVSVSVCPTEQTEKSATDVKYPVSLYYHGIFAEGRGLDELILAMKHIQPEKAHLYLRGFGDMKTQLELLIKKNDLATKITILEPLPSEELSKAAANFDVGLTMAQLDVVNHRFACGFKTLDNINAGMALMVPDGFVLNKLVTDNNIGFVYKDGVENHLTECIHQIIENTDVIPQMKKNSTELASTYLNRSKQAEIFWKEIEILLNNVN